MVGLLVLLLLWLVLSLSLWSSAECEPASSVMVIDAIPAVASSDFSALLRFARIGAERSGLSACMSVSWMDRPLLLLLLLLGMLAWRWFWCCVGEDGDVGGAGGRRDRRLAIMLSM